MTPEERAKVIREKMLAATRPGGYIDNAEIERVIAEAIREAVADETARCAKVAAAVSPTLEHAIIVSDAIRARVSR